MHYHLTQQQRIELSLLMRIGHTQRNASQSTGVFIANATGKIANLKSKLQRPLDSYLDQDIEAETYAGKKVELMGEKSRQSNKTAN